MYACTYTCTHARTYILTYIHTYIHIYILPSLVLAMTMPLPPRAVTRNPILKIVMIAKPSALTRIPAKRQEKKETKESY